MSWNVDPDRRFDYENGFYLTASVDRFGKFVTHLDLFRRTAGIPGEIVECGVFKGASLFRWIKFRELLENTSSRRIVAFDTFGSFPDAGYEPDRVRRDRFVEEAGDQSIPEARLRELLEAQDLDGNVELFAGDILETVPAFAERNPEFRISLLHIDVDLLEPTRCCLEVLYPRVVPGGIVILDDYGAFPGASLAVEDFFKGMRFQKMPYSHAVTFVEKP